MDNYQLMCELAVDTHRLLSERHGSMMASVIMLTGLTVEQIDALGGVREES